MPPVTLTRIDPEQNMRRFYRVSIQPGLFGDWSLIREWGRIGTQGQGMEEWFDSEEEADHAAGRIQQSKQRRGYRDQFNPDADS